MAKKQKAVMTNAVRMISAAKLPFETMEYDAEGEIGDNFGEYIAEKTNSPKERFFKTLVLRGEKQGIMVACIPCNCEVDLKKVAKIAKDKKVEMIHVKELLGLTGYIRGSVSPIGMKKKYSTYINITACDFESIFISGGVCGLAVKMAPNDIQKITDCEFADITAEK